LTVRNDAAALSAAGDRISRPSGRLFALLAAAAILTLHMGNPAVWGAAPGLWAPAAGVGFVLVAWFGRRGAWLVVTAGLLALMQAVVVAAVAGKIDSSLLALAAGDAVLGAAEVLAAWAVYRRLGGARALVDPRSAVVFVLVVPGLMAATFAAAHAVLTAAILGQWAGFGLLLAQRWLSRSLGLLTVAPPLLSAATPWLVRRGLVRPEVLTAKQSATVTHAGADRLTQGDVIEIAGLALGAGLLALLLACTYGRQALDGWQPWGAPLLVIVWASLRQGQRGGVLAAGLAAAFALCLLGVLSCAPAGYVSLIQGHLLGLGGAGLLAAAAAGWLHINEVRYRQVVTHAPVVVYSARLAPGRAAEVTLVSAASVPLLGCPPEQLLGDYGRWLERVHPEDREVVLAAVAQLGRQKQPVACEYRLASPHGTALEDAPWYRSHSDPPGKQDGAATPRKHLTPIKQRWVRDVLAPHFDAEGRLSGWEGVVTEVTEQRAMAVDLRRTMSMFQALVTNLPAGVFFVQGPAGNPILVNNRARQLLGRREDTSAGLDHIANVYHLCRPDGSLYPAEELPVYQALREGLTAMRDDVVVHQPDGRRVPLITWAAPIRLGGPGQPEAAVWVLEDLTALHQAEAARRDTEGRLRTVVEAMGEGLVVQDRKGSVVDCNAAAAAIFHRSPEQLRGASLFDSWSYLREDGAPLPNEEHPVRIVLRTGRPVRNFVLGLPPSGEGAGGGPRWFLVNAMPLAGGGAAVGAVTTYSDVTAYRRAQEVLRASEEKYRGLIESMPLMLVQSDRAMRVEYVNPALESITGYKAEEISDPAAWARFIHADDLQRVRALAADALAGRPGRLEFRYFAKDGSTKTAFAMGEPRRQDGAVVGYTTLLVDVTRERQLEQDLQRAQRLELIGRLSSGIAHDFNNLLTVVLSLSEVAHGGLPPDHPVHGDLRRITEAGEQAASLAGQLLAFSRQQRAAGRRAETNRTARRTLDLLRAALPTIIRLEVALEDGELHVPLEETQLQQVVMNLCLNARDAMPDGGRLRVRTEAIAGPGDRGAPWVRLSVADEGCGVPDDLKTRIFDPFFSTKERGTGLGLAVVRQIVEGCGGRIEFQSEVGRGSCFEVWLPTRAPAVAAAVALVEDTIAQGI
jgi:PAS domain S-box-containing protein